MLTVCVSVRVYEQNNSKLCSQILMNYAALGHTIRTIIRLPGAYELRSAAHVLGFAPPFSGYTLWMHSILVNHNNTKTVFVIYSI